MNKRIIIIGAGPTGIGAAYRLADIGHTNFAIYEKNNYIGGLSASFKDAQGYTHDIGGHVLFSHYPYFDMAVEKSLNGHYVEHQREAWIFGYGKTIPYPFQNNIRHLNKDMLWECIEGLLKLTPNLSPQNFGEWIDCTFGVGIGKYFMHPYNLKVWAYPTDLMAHHWISERVSVINLEKILKNVIYEIDEKSWGPNNLFKFPLYGGTQAIFSGMIAGFQDKLHLNEEIIGINPIIKTVTFKSGKTDTYDELISTIPIDQLVHSLATPEEKLINAAKDLLHNNGYSIGIGVRRPVSAENKTKCWNYFPENNAPFYRVTYLSNYSPNMTPNSESMLLMAETSYSSHKQINAGSIIDDTIDGLITYGLINECDREQIDTAYCIPINYGYPIPSLNRNTALTTLLPELKNRNIYSRGRFGAWQYEVGNMDHSFMQGVEVIDYLLHNKEETTLLIK